MNELTDYVVVFGSTIEDLRLSVLDKAKEKFTVTGGIVFVKGNMVHMTPHTPPLENTIGLFYQAMAKIEEEQDDS